MKKMLLVLISLFVLFSSIACHRNIASKEFVFPLEFDESRDYEIVFWAKNDSNIYQKKIYEKAIVDFEKIYPNIKVKMKSYNDYSKIYNDVITNVSTKTTPNVCITYPDHVATYNNGDNIVVCLDDLINNENYGMSGSSIKFDNVKKEEVVQKYLEECFFENHYYAMPFMRSTEACYVNEDYVKKLGFELPEVLTWDFIWEVSEKAIIEKEQNQVLIPVIYKSTDNMLIQMLKQNDFDYSTEEGEVLLFNDDTKGLLKDLSDKINKRYFSTFKYSSYPGNFFNAGQCIFAIDSTAGSTWIGSDAPLLDISRDSVVKFKTRVMEIPTFPGKANKMISQGPSLCLFNKEDPQEVLASWIFMQYLLTNDVQISYSQTEGYVPVTTKAQKDEKYVDYLNRAGEVITKTNASGEEVVDNGTYYEVKINATKLLLNNVYNTFVTYPFSGSASLRDAAGSLIENTLLNAKRGNACDDRYFDKLFSSQKAMLRINKDLGPMPIESIILITIIGLTWIGLISYGICFIYKKRKTKNV